MRRMRYGKTGLIVLALGFCVFYGMDVATKGIEQINGPAAGRAEASAASPSPKPTAKPTSKPPAAGMKAASAQEKAGGAAVQPPRQGAELETSFVNRLSNRIGDALRLMASGLMQLVSSFFEGLLG